MVRTRARSHRIHLLPSHHLFDGHLSAKDEPSSVNREILSRKLRLRELLDIRGKVIGQDWVRPATSDDQRQPPKDVSQTRYVPRIER